MKRVLIAAFVFASVSFGKDWEPDQIQISDHREEVFALARDYVVETFNLTVKDESVFNPVRFNSRGVWGNFEARIKELGDDRFEVQGWINATGHERVHTGWTVHIRYGMEDPEGWRYRRVDEEYSNDPEVLGWKFGQYRSADYEAEYAPAFVAAMR